MKRTAVGAICALVALCASAVGAGVYRWAWEPLVLPDDSVYDNSNHLWLTPNNGSHAVALGDGTWTSVAAFNSDTFGVEGVGVRAFEWSGYTRQSPYDVFRPNDTPYTNPGFPCVAANDRWKLWMCSDYNDAGTVKNACLAKTDSLRAHGPANFIRFTAGTHHENKDHCLAALCFPGYDTIMVASYSDSCDDSTYRLTARTSADRGQDWSDTIRIQYGHNTEPSLAKGSGYDVYVAYKRDSVSTNTIFFERSTNGGGTWGNARVTLGTGTRPCIAAVGQFVFVCWHSTDSMILYRYSTNSGTDWDPPVGSSPHTRGGSGIFSQTNVSAVTCGSRPAVILASQWSNGGKWLVFYDFGLFVTDHIAWQTGGVFPHVFYTNPRGMRPSLTTSGINGRLVYNCPSDYHKRGFYLRRGHAWNDTGPYRQDAVSVSSGRPLARGPDGSMQYVSVIRPHVVSGPADADLLPILVAPGSQPALALDGAGNRWVSYVCDDTVWTMTGDGSYEAVFAGSSSAVPGQPSVVCYPQQSGGVFVANVVFAVYDTAGGASRIMYARVDIGGVVLDTIESVANLGDSLPCINVYKTDSLVVTWQHGDSTLAAMLCDYGPGTSGQVPAWSSPSLVSANSYHAMSAFDEGGSVLNCVWTRNNGSNYAVQRATCDLASALFGNWSQSATPGDTGSAEKANPVFAGLGVSCWQQKDANGKWTIKGFVRGEETTLVANDTDAYHPHAVAESSAISPSIDQVRVHLLYTAGVTFEVDSGVYDTGETRYMCESLSVSHACSDATKANNGAKLLRKNGSDSLFSVYSDLDNAVVFAWSANGDTWQRSVMASGRDYPAIAEDSSGKRWVVMHKPSQSINLPIQEAYYRNGSSWTGPETLYAVSGTTLGPASLSGSSHASSGIAYAAFLCTAGGGSQSVILAKFNGSVVSTYTVATGSTLGDPTLAVEPYLADSDHVHVSWEDNGVIKYRMDTDGRSSSIANNWTSTYDLTGRGTVAQHPSINSDHDQIVVAWAQGDTTDIYCRKRSTDSAYNNWEAAANLSNTAGKFSDWPTIAMGDSVIVAWEERRSTTDYDILVCVDSADTLNIADNSTKSSYPHVLFQTQDSTPYVHLVYCEEPQSNYYEVGYNKCDLKKAGEGQQSASQTPIPTKPVLNACRPNPLRSHTQISYALPTAGNVSLRVYDVTGRTVRTLASGHQKAGSYSVSWDAKDSRGRQVPRGVYFYRLDTPGFRAVKKAVVAR